MNAIGRLGNLYGLSPATLSGLANVAGAAPDPDAEWKADQAEQAAFAAANGLPAVTPLAPPAPDAPLVTAASAASQATGQTTPILAGPFSSPGGAPAQEAAPSTNAPSPANDAGPMPTAQPAHVAPAQTIPAHWQPGSHTVNVQHGIDAKALAPGLIESGASLKSAEQAGDARYQAAQLTHEADVAAGQSAAKQMAVAQEQLRALDAQRKAYIDTERKKLDALNLESQRRVNVDDAFEGGVGGRIAAAVMMGIGQFAAAWKGGTNAAMQIVNDGIDASIKRQQANAAMARGAFADRMSLYRDNLQAFGEERAGLATKIQLLDKVAQMADERRAKAGALGNDAAHADFMRTVQKERAGVLNEFGEKTADKYGEQMTESFKPAQTVGGASKREGNLVTLSDGTTFVMPSEKTAGEAIGKIQTLDQLQRINNEILQLRGKAAKLDPVMNFTEYQTVKAQLEDVGEQKAALVSKSLEQGVLKDSEYERSMQKNVGVLNGLGLFKGNPKAAAERDSTDAMLRAQTDRWAKDQRSHVTSAGGAVYERQYTTDAKGNLVPTGQYTGQDATPTEHRAPNGSKPLDGKTVIPTPGPKTANTIPMAPRR